MSKNQKTLAVECEGFDWGSKETQSIRESKTQQNCEGKFKVDYTML